MTKILVPVDFSETSLNALSYAIKLFEHRDVEFTILHTYELSKSAFHMKSIDRILEEDAQREMKTLIKNTLDKYPDIVLVPKIHNADAVYTIKSLGNSGEYDFIIMGTKGASGLKEVFLGSVAGGVISKTSAPVIIVPDKYDYTPLKEIVLAIGSIPLHDLTILDPLRKLAMVQSSKIKILHISEGDKLDMEDVLSSLQDFHPSVTYVFGEGNINKELNEYIIEDHTGLLCLIKSKKAFFTRVFGGSVTMKQTFSSPIPLIILNDK
jgi:nucleotide-binding universal stress UspA family protein